MFEPDRAAKAQQDSRLLKIRLKPDRTYDDGPIVTAWGAPSTASCASP
jgi:hypothetical protein